jgi:hypothetical protein
MNNLRKAIRAGSLTWLVAVFSICAGASEWQRGDVFVGIGGGQYQVWRQTGTGEGGPIYTLVETITDGSGTVSGENGLGGTGFTGGCAFDSTSHLYSTNFSNTKVFKFGIPDPHTVTQIIDTNAVAPGGDSESIVFDGSGNFLVGNADFHPDEDLTKAVVLQYSPAGTLLNTFTVATENRGSDWVELSADGNTLYYTSEGTSIKSFNLSTNTQGPDFFNEDGGGPLYTVRILPPSFGQFAGDFLVANTANVLRLHVSDGVTIAQTYIISGATSLFALGLDTNGTSFWIQDAASENVYRVNIATGNVEVSLPTGGVAGGGGICVDGLATAAQPQPVVQIITLTPTKRTGTVFNDNNSNSWRTTLNGLTTTAHVTIAFTEIPQSLGNSDIPTYGPCELQSADGTKCVVHQISVDTTAFNSIDFYHHWDFKPTSPINPRMIKNGTKDITTSVYLDPGIKGHTTTPSTYVDNEAPTTTGSSCGFLFPPNNFTWEAEYPLTFVFTAVPVGQSCGNGPFLTTLKPSISVARIGTGGTVTPITLGTTLFKDFYGAWYYTLKTSNLKPGTYIVSVFDKSNQIAAFSEQIVIVPED